MARELLNTLYVTTEGAYAHLLGDTVSVEAEGRQLARVPLLHLGAIVLFGGASMSPKLIMRCADDGRAVVYLDHGGRFRARVEGPVSGNVLLRDAQQQAYRDPSRSMAICRAIVAAKIRNSRMNLLRGARDSRDPEATAALRTAARLMGQMGPNLGEAESADVVRGIEGQAASLYFGAFSRLITRPPEEFTFTHRSRRPPRDRANALLSFTYALMMGDCMAALEGVGLDPQFGYLHAIRPAKPALALDLMEEFRPGLADRLVLTLINRKQVQPQHFEEREGGAVLLNEEGRKTLLVEYQRRKMELVHHPFLKQQTPLGLVPHLQARLLARHLRGDLETYLPFVPSK